MFNGANELSPQRAAGNSDLKKTFSMYKQLN